MFNFQRLHRAVAEFFKLLEQLHYLCFQQKVLIIEFCSWFVLSAELDFTYYLRRRIVYWLAGTNYKVLQAAEMYGLQQFDQVPLPC